MASSIASIAKSDVGPVRADAGALVQGLAALFWLPQAAFLALAVQRIADGGGLAGVMGPAAGIALLGLGRAGCEAWGLRRSFVMARARLAVCRAQVADALAARSPLDRARPPSGLAASVIAEQAKALLPWLVRYQPARWRAMAVPPLIALAVASLSWTAALVLLLAAPLIPLFMAIVGWRAKAASEAQMLQLGGMNAFLLDRLRGLATLRALDAVDATALRPARGRRGAAAAHHGRAAHRLSLLGGAGAVRGAGRRDGRGVRRLSSARRISSSAPGAGA